MKRSTCRALIGASVLTAATASQAALDAAVTTGISTAVADILAVVALGGAAFVVISGGGVVWNVASKFIKRLGGKA